MFQPSVISPISMSLSSSPVSEGPVVVGTPRLGRVEVLKILLRGSAVFVTCPPFASKMRFRARRTASSSAFRMVPLTRTTRKTQGLPFLTGTEFMKVNAVQTSRYEARAMRRMKVEVACERYLTTHDHDW